MALESLGYPPLLAELPRLAALLSGTAVPVHFPPAEGRGACCNSSPAPSYSRQGRTVNFLATISYPVTQYFNPESPRSSTVQAFFQSLQYKAKVQDASPHLSSRARPLQAVNKLVYRALITFQVCTDSRGCRCTCCSACWLGISVLRTLNTLTCCNSPPHCPLMTVR